MGLFRLGFLMRFFSPAVLTGFISGSAINIGSNQLANLFGVRVPSAARRARARLTAACCPPPSRCAGTVGAQVSIPTTNYVWMTVYYICQQLPNTKWLAITMGLLTIAIIISVRKYERAVRPRCPPRR